MSSYFWDRATDAGIIGDKAAITWTLKPNDFSAAAAKACSSSVATLHHHFPNVCGPAPSVCWTLSGYLRRKQHFVLRLSGVCSPTASSAERWLLL